MTVDSQQLRLNPRHLVDELRGLPMDDFQRLYAQTQLLLVDLGFDGQELADGLNNSFRRSSTNSRPSIMSFGQTTLSFPTISSAVTRTDLDGMDRIHLLAKIKGAPFFIVPLLDPALVDLEGDAELPPAESSTDGTGPSFRLTIGRTRECRIVLRNPSVSKAHAAFDVDRSGSLSLTDAGSRNGTRVNGKLIKAGETAWIQPLDHIQFGSVSTFTCSPAVLRSVLRSGSRLPKSEHLMG